MDFKKELGELERNLKLQGALGERLRIMQALDNLDLPAGVWSMIKSVFEDPTK